MEQSEEQLKKRFIELAKTSEVQSRYVFTDFLSLAEQDLFYQAMRTIGYRDYSLFGGVEGAERVMIKFGREDSLGYNMEFPIHCIKIAPFMEKFAEALSHRDYLGALMNLGIERSLLGDIIIKDKNAYVFCVERMSDYIVSDLEQVKRTRMKCSVTTEDMEAVRPKLEALEFVAEAERADGVVSKVYNMSRSKSSLLFKEKKIFVNGRLIENNSTVLKEGDIVSVRGFGKFCYEGTTRETKKGKLRIKVQKYV